MGSGRFSWLIREEERPDLVSGFSQTKRPGRMSRRSTALLAAAIAACVASPAAAQEAVASPPAVTARFQVDWLSAVRATSPADTPLNPGNARLRVPGWTTRTELRGNLRVGIGSRAQVVVRPRAFGSAEWIDEAGRPRSRREEGDAEVTEAYLSWTLADALTLTYGLQNFQWGPAELVAPNNRVFHETGVFRDPLYYVPGRHLLRVNVSAGRQWSLVTLAEVGAPANEAFRAGERFARQALAKVEFTTADGASYAGGTVGVTDGAPWWIGGYGSWALTEGLSVYADTSHTRGSQAWYPVAPAGVRPGFARTRSGDASWTTLAVTGGRYTFARGDDLRVEWLFQQAGWGETDLRDAFAIASRATSAAAFAPYVQPGLEFLGRQLVLVSLRTPELPPRRRSEVQTRYLHSFTDGSRVLFVTGRVEATGRLVVFASGTLTGGADHGEFSRLVRGSLVAGTSVTW